MFTSSFWHHKHCLQIEKLQLKPCSPFNPAIWAQHVTVRTAVSEMQDNKTSEEVEVNLVKYWKDILCACLLLSYQLVIVYQSVNQPKYWAGIIVYVFSFMMKALGELVSGGQQEEDRRSLYV